MPEVISPRSLFRGYLMADREIGAVWTGSPEGYRPNLPMARGAQPHNAFVYASDHQRCLGDPPHRVPDAGIRARTETLSRATRQSTLCESVPPPRTGRYSLANTTRS